MGGGINIIRQKFPGDSVWIFFILELIHKKLNWNPPSTSKRIDSL